MRNRAVNNCILVVDLLHLLRELKASTLKQLPILLILMVGCDVAEADPKQDCVNLRADAGIQACNEAIRRTPRDAQLYVTRGVRYQEDQNDLDRAMADYAKAVEIDPRLAVAYNNRAVVYGLQGDLNHAIADATKAIGIDPKYAKAYGARGEAYSRKRDFDRAIADLDRAIALDPKLSGAYVSRAWLRATFNRDLPLALSDCDAATRIRPNNSDQLDTRALVFLRLNRLAEAIADYDSALKIDPENAPSLYGRGLAKRKKGDRTGGDADIVAAEAIKADIADEFAKYGMN